MTETNCGEECVDGSECQRPAGWGLEADIGPCQQHLEGRPSKFTKERRGEVLEAARIGKSETGCARAAGVAWDTLARWLERDEDFRGAFRRARDAGEQRLIKDGLYNPDADSSMAKFLLSTSFDYVKTEKRKHEHSGAGGGPLEIVLNEQVVETDWEE